MSKLVRVWETPYKHQGSTARVEEWDHNDDTLHYIFIKAFYQGNVKDFNEAQKLIEGWKMREVTEEYRKGGWIG